MFYFILLIYFKTMNKYESAIEHLNIQNMQNVSNTLFFKSNAKQTIKLKIPLHVAKN